MAATTVPCCLSSDQRPALSSRRTVLGTLAVAGASAAVLVSAQAADPHVEWHREWRALVDWWNGPAEPGKNSDTHPAWLRLMELEDLIADTPATTEAGMLCQIDVALQNCGYEDPSHECDGIEERVLVTLRATLARSARA